MQANITPAEALELFKKYNTDPFLTRHAFTVSAVMKNLAQTEGFPQEADFWLIVGLLHDIDFELYPQEHCVKAVELLKEGGCSPELIHAVVSHSYGMNGITVKPEHFMEKLLFACDELTGLIWSASLLRPSKSVSDMELKSVKKKYKTANFAAGCSRAVIEQGAEMLGWELDVLITKTLQAMQNTEKEIEEALA